MLDILPDVQTHFPMERVWLLDLLVSLVVLGYAYKENLVAALVVDLKHGGEEATTVLLLVDLVEVRICPNAELQVVQLPLVVSQKCCVSILVYRIYI